MSTPIETLARLSQNPSRVVAGLMSGTSADMIDVAICRFRGFGRNVEFELLHHGESRFDPEVRRQIVTADQLGLRALAELNIRVAEEFARAWREGVRASGLSPERIDLIGSHGQTVYHHSGVPGSARSTLQVGDADVIAARTGCAVFADFRAKDIALGGEGAPLSPIADAVLFRVATGTRRAILNLGGIANLTVLDADPSRTFGFDTGPANAPLDRLARRLTRGALDCDRDGLIARSGRINEPLLANLLENDLFLSRRPPKSTGFEMYGDSFVDRAVEAHGGEDADLMATLTEFTARSVALAFQRYLPADAPLEEIVVAGGGLKNPALMDRLAAHLSPVRVRSSDEFGVPSDAREAMAFAVLADMSLRGESADLPSITGAGRAAILGKLAFP